MTVVISGGASGLGAAIASALADAGDHPVVIDRQAPTAGIEHRLVDLSEPRHAEAVVTEVAQGCERLNAVVTCAAIDEPDHFEDIDGATWDRIITVNLLGTAAVIRGALPRLITDRGRIVTVASTLGLRTLPAATAYAASKFGVVGMTRALTMELAGRVGVTMLVPGGMRTAFFDGRADEYRPAADQMLNDPADVAKAVLFALAQPPGCEIREMIVTPSNEPSWP